MDYYLLVKHSDGACRSTSIHETVYEAFIEDKELYAYMCKNSLINLDTKLGIVLGPFNYSKELSRILGYSAKLEFRCSKVR